MSNLAGDSPAAGLVALFDVLAGDQREQPDEALLVVIQLDTVEGGEDRQRVVHEPGDELVACCLVVPRAHRLARRVVVMR